jgi:hypothetical protein
MGVMGLSGLLRIRRVKVRKRERVGIRTQNGWVFPKTAKSDWGASEQFFPNRGASEQLGEM